MRDLPRTNRNFRPQRSSYIAYKNRRVPPYMLGPEDITESGDKFVLTSSRIGTFRIDELDVSDLSPMPDPIVQIFMDATAEMRRIIVDRLEQSNMAVLPGDEPSYTLSVSIHSAGRISAWPVVPGVTGDPYQRVLSLHVPTTVKEFNQLVHKYRELERENFEVILWMNPLALVTLICHGWADYFPHIETKEDMRPSNIIDLMVRVG